MFGEIYKRIIFLIKIKKIHLLFQMNLILSNIMYTQRTFRYAQQLTPEFRNKNIFSGAQIQCI